ncbi:hypothetical protein MMC21_003691 [Puttea exsequens]|nr:hypothetical protein [Puttea exsequens]
MAGGGGNHNLKRTSSQLSSASHRSDNARIRTRKQSLVTPDSAKTLESFPSLSPDASPGSKTDKQLTAIPSLPTTSHTSRGPSKQSPSMVESLITSTPSFRGRSALFDDSPRASPEFVPGSLHLSTDADIRQLIKKSGAIVLVRQLAEDVAQRDAEISSLRRRAEERERELKTMLREVKVSNKDIETRLHRIENPAEDDAGLGELPKKGDLKSGGLRDGKRRHSRATSGIDEMMGEAMNDKVGKLSDELDGTYLDPSDQSERQATVKARNFTSKDSDARSTASSVDSRGRSSSTLRGWKDYLWSGNGTSHRTSRTSSIITENNEESGTTVRTRGFSNGIGRRKALDDELFQPPERALTTEPSSASGSRKSSTSGLSWATRLFAGNFQAGRDADKGTMRGRSSTAGSKPKPSRTASAATDPVPRTAVAALMRVNSKEPLTRAPKKSVQPLTLGLTGIKNANQPSQSQLPTSPRSTTASNNPGPVEMDTIHAPDSMPPTLTHTKKTDNPSDLLTDRFGFIYDQRWRRRQAEAIKGHHRGKSNASTHVETIGGARDSLRAIEQDTASVHSKANSMNRPDTPASQEEVAEDQQGKSAKPTKGWQEYLKVPAFPTELLSHTPAPKPSTTIISPDSPSLRLKRLPTGNDARGSLPSISHNPEPEMSPVTAGNAELSQTSLNPAMALTPSAASDAEPVKLLLAQINELHDKKQREKEQKWNPFLRKLMSERKEELGSHTPSVSRFNTMPEVALADGEIIGVAGLGNKGKIGHTKWREFKNLVLNGIPVTLRPKVWAECSGAVALRLPGYYDDLVANTALDDPSIVSQIQMDIRRTLTDNTFFRNGVGVSKLNEVLLAYARRNPDVGYCQGMNLITANLLLVMPTAEDAFWVLTSLIEHILPPNYYDHSLLASRADQKVLRQYVTDILPRLSAHLNALGIELEALTFQWFLSVFTDCLSAEALFRVWDVVFCFNEGSTFLFQVALALLKLNEGPLLECESAARVYGYIGNEVTDHAISIDGLVGASHALRGIVGREEVERRRGKAVEEEREGASGRGRGRGGSEVTTGTSENRELSVQEPRPVE